MLERPTAIRLDCPLERKEARTRGIDATLSRLLIEGQREVLAELIHSCCPHGKRVVIHAIGQFTPLYELTTVFKQSSIEVFIDQGFVVAKNKEQISFIFSQWSAEILVAFFADEATAGLIVGLLSKSYPKWWRFSQEGYEAPYLKQLQLADPFFFFSPTRSSLEVIGSESEVMRCFNRVRSLGPT